MGIQSQKHKLQLTYYVKQNPNQTMIIQLHDNSNSDNPNSDNSNSFENFQGAISQIIILN